VAFERGGKVYSIEKNKFRNLLIVRLGTLRVLFLILNKKVMFRLNRMKI
jgi:hypothetical protein